MTAQDSDEAHKRVKAIQHEIMENLKRISKGNTDLEKILTHLAIFDACSFAAKDIWRTQKEQLQLDHEEHLPVVALMAGLYLKATLAEWNSAEYAWNAMKQQLEMNTEDQLPIALISAVLYVSNLLTRIIELFSGIATKKSSVNAISHEDTSLLGYI